MSTAAKIGIALIGISLVAAAILAGFWLAEKVAP